MNGFLYVLVNSSIPGLCKVGRTARTAAERGAELSAATGVATPFIVAFEQRFADCDVAEARVHAILDERGWRVARNREFFRAPAAEIVHVMLDVAASTPAADDARRALRQAHAEALLEAGDRALLGLADTLQDPEEALRFYRAAVQHGSPLAHERLGGLLARAQPGSRVDRQRALRLLQEGAARGNHFCLAELGVLYARTGQAANMDKAWALFFRRHDEAAARGEPDDPARFVEACRLYLETCLSRGLPVAHAALLAPHAVDLAQRYLDLLDQARGAPGKRAAIATAMRWVHDHLSEIVEPPTRPRRFWLVRTRRPAPMARVQGLA